MRTRRAVLLAFLYICAAAALAAQTAPTLSIGGVVAKPSSLSVADLAALPQETVALNEEGESVQYGGVLLSTLLTRAGALNGAPMRGKALASYVLAEAKDGYRVVFSLGEIDPEFGASKIVVATTRNGKALFDYQGPFRLIVAGDKRGARGVRMLTKLTVVQLPD